MTFTEAEDNLSAMQFCRRVSERGLVEIGVMRVLYGYRVRAGFVGEMYSHLDWCAGADWSHVESLYTMCLAVLASRPEDRSCFNGVPSVSSVKPFFNDPQFIRDVAALIDPQTTVEPVQLDSANIVRHFSHLWL